MRHRANLDATRMVHIRVWPQPYAGRPRACPELVEGLASVLWTLTWVTGRLSFRITYDFCHSERSEESLSLPRTLGEARISSGALTDNENVHPM